MRLDPLFSLLTLPPLVKLLCVSYWSIFCNRIVVSVLTSSHSSHTIASHVSPWKEKSCSSHIWVRESYLWYPFLLFPSLYELTERNNFIFFKRDAIALPLQYDHVSTNLYLLVNPTLYLYHERPTHYVLDRYILIFARWRCENILVNHKWRVLNWYIAITLKDLLCCIRSNRSMTIRPHITTDAKIMMVSNNFIFRLQKNSNTSSSSLSLIPILP